MGFNSGLKGLTVTTPLDTLYPQPWLCVGMLCERTIFCASYKGIHVLLTLISVTIKFWTVTVTSPQLVYVNNCDLLLVHLPHNFHTHFSHIYQESFCNIVRLAQTLLDRNVRVCRIMRANRGIHVT
jgi:hypothetical protein